MDTFSSTLLILRHDTRFVVSDEEFGVPAPFFLFAGRRVF